MAKSTSKSKSDDFTAIVSKVVSKYFDIIGIETKISKNFFGVWCGLWTFNIFMATGRQGADNPDSLFIMAGASQKYFTHEIPKCDSNDTRYSLTFREFKD